jgi:phage shock protein A
MAHEQQHSAITDAGDLVCALADEVGTQTGKLDRELRALRQRVAELENELATLRNIKTSANVALIRGRDASS